MTRRSNIEWTWVTWNPVTGCNKISDGCTHCYANRMALRLQGMGVDKYRYGFDVTTHPDVLNVPRRLPKPQIIFVNSMGDLFHDKVPDVFIKQVFSVMTKCPQHVFQVLTKRSARLRRIQSEIPWPNNVWMGVTVENAHYKYRIEDLRATPAFIKFLSVEPFLGPLPDLDLAGIGWVAVGGESGPGARPMKEECVLDLKDQCRKAGTAFFFKQWGGVNKKKTGRLLKGKIYDEMPTCPQFESGQVSLF
ncbi:MAG: phage Gp37/Gp68 family protein [Candidatus Zixiibacteriota bacterium]|nr:MAG: phage Gp37/Gp68 family protein [candidate division Zixibacteria bacterium]